MAVAVAVAVRGVRHVAGAAASTWAETLDQRLPGKATWQRELSTRGTELKETSRRRTFGTGRRRRRRRCGTGRWRRATRRRGRRPGRRRVRVVGPGGPGAGRRTGSSPGTGRRRRVRVPRGAHAANAPGVGVGFVPPAPRGGARGGGTSVAGAHPTHPGDERRRVRGSPRGGVLRPAASARRAARVTGTGAARRARAG